MSKSELKLKLVVRGSPYDWDKAAKLAKQLLVWASRSFLFGNMLSQEMHFINKCSSRRVPESLSSANFSFKLLISRRKMSELECRMRL